MTNEEAIKVLKANYPDACFEQLREAVYAAIEALKAQDADSDTISRKAAIDAILAVTGNSSVRELYEHVQEHGLSDMWSGGVNAAIDIIIAVPPVHPEPCEDTISRKAAIDAVKGLLDSMLETDTIGFYEIENILFEVPSAQPEQQWIPWHSGKFPEESGTYTVTAYDGATERVTYAKYQKRLKRWKLTGARAYWRVLAWMPKPEPYKEGE